MFGQFRPALVNQSDNCNIRDRGVETWHNKLGMEWEHDSPKYHYNHASLALKGLVHVTTVPDPPRPQLLPFLRNAQLAVACLRLKVCSLPVLSWIKVVTSSLQPRHHEAPTRALWGTQRWWRHCPGHEIPTVTFFSQVSNLIIRNSMTEYEILRLPTCFLSGKHSVPKFPTSFFDVTHTSWRQQWSSLLWERLWLTGMGPQQSRLLHDPVSCIADRSRGNEPKMFQSGPPCYPQSITLG